MELTELADVKFVEAKSSRNMAATAIRVVTRVGCYKERTADKNIRRFNFTLYEENTRWTFL